MGQFKPMVKMMTTEPSVELKLAKGGAVKMKKGGSTTKAKKMADGGMSAMGMMAGTPALVGRPAVNAPVRAPGKPSMAARRKAMMAKPAATPAMPTMKKGGKAEGGESKKTHMAEMSKMKGLEKELKSHASKPASKGHKGLKTGGVINGQGGYKAGGGVAGNGIINTEKQGGAYRDTMMHTAKPNHSSAKTGGVKLGNGGGYKDGGMTMVEKGGKMVPDFAADGVGKMKRGGMMGGGMMSGYKTGGVTKSNAGGYKMGGKTSKKAYATGGTVNTGKPVAMPQGAKKPSTPVSINKLSGTFKKGGKVTPAESRLMKNFASENKTAMKQAKAQSNEIYSKYGNMKMAGGGSTDMSKGAYDASKKHSRELEDAMNPLSMMKELAGKAKDYFMPKGSESVTKTKESVTVSPATKKRGGGAC